MNDDTEKAPLDVFWVREGRLMAGEYPGDWEPERAKEKVRWLVESGITAFIDLTEAGELRPYAGFLPSESGAGRAIEHLRKPVRDLNVPTEEEMVRILDLIDAKLEEGHTVYVHCWGGVGRTGTVIACHLARHGTSGQAALDALRAVRQNSKKVGREAPETGAQRRMVLGWPEGR